MTRPKDFLGLEGMTADAIHELLDLSENFKAISRRRIKKVPSLRGRTILNAFFEASTRTRVSFELAGKRLSADTVNISASGSAVSKGETLLDTAQTLDAMQVDAVVLRHAQSGAPGFIGKRIKAQVINAGDGLHAHPSQALLDMKTIRDRFGTIEGLEVAIVGDVLHSRVARSNLVALKTLGAQVRVAGPKTLLPRYLNKNYGCEVVGTVKEALTGAHVVMALRLQKERMTSGLLPSLREYSTEYGVNAHMLRLLRPEGILMHPGPVNRGVELAADIVDGEQSVILDQVENGVAIRCALLYTLLGGEGP